VKKKYRLLTLNRRLNNLALQFNQAIQTSELTYLPNRELSTLSEKIKRENFSEWEGEKR